MTSAPLWLPLKRVVTSEGFFAVLSVFGLLSSLAVFVLSVLN